MLIELFITGRKLNISLVYIKQSYFALSKHIRLNCTHCFNMKIPNKQELQQIAINHSSNIEFKDLSVKSYSFKVNDTTLAWDNHLRFRHNLYEKT